MAEFGLAAPVLLIFMRQPHKGASWGGAVKNYRFVTVHERRFIAGQFVSRKAYWGKDRSCLLSWDQVDTVFEFESEEAYFEMNGIPRSSWTGWLRR